MSDTQIFKETSSVTYPLPGQEVTQGPTVTRQVQGIGYQPSIGGGYAGGRETATPSLEVGVPVDRVLEIRKLVDAYGREKAALDAEAQPHYVSPPFAPPPQQELRVELPPPHVDTSGIGSPLALLVVALLAVGIMLLFRGR